MKTYKKGQVIAEGINASLMLGMAIAVITMITIVTSNLSAKVYSQFEDDINAITDEDVKTAVEEASKSGFESLTEYAEFQPTLSVVMIIAVIMFVFLGVFYGGGLLGGRTGGVGAAL